MNNNKYKRKIYTAIITTLFTFLGFAPTTLRAQDKEIAPQPETYTDAPQVAPANDNFDNAQLLTGASGSTTGTNAGATKEAGEATHAFNRGGRSVWFEYIATGDGVLTIDTVGSNFDTLLAVYQNNDFTDLNSFYAANDDIDSIQNTRSRVVVGTKSGRAYYIVVDGYNGGGGAGSGSISLNYSLSNVVPNDNFANAIVLPGASGRLISTTNVGASKEIGEPNHNNNVGGKSIWFKWTAPLGATKSYTFSSVVKGNIGGAGIACAAAIYTGTSVDSLTRVASGYFVEENNHFGKMIFTATPGTAYYIALDGYDGGQGAYTGTFTISYGITKTDKSPDFDRDGKTDITVFRPTTGTWYSLDSITDNVRGYQWGGNADKPLLSDDTDDGVPDYTVFRPDIGEWFAKSSFFNSYSYQWGANTDVPMIFKNYHITVPSTGHIVTNLAVFRPQTGAWYILGASNVQFGQLGDIPMTADFDGDGTDEIAVFRPSNGYWYLYDTVSGRYGARQFGQSGDKPVAADYDGDGKVDIAVFRPSTGAWYVSRSSDSQVQAMAFGVSTDVPQPADYDGDSKADYAVYRPSNGTWYIWQSGSQTMRAVAFGATGDVPVAAPNQLQ